MASHRTEVLGKRGRRATTLDQPDGHPVTRLKRSRARKPGAVDQEATVPDTAASTSNVRSGLLTPEMTSLSESQSCLSSLDSKDGLPEKDIFNFMSLPTELRLHIYHMALVRNEPIELHTARPVTAEPIPLSTSDDDDSQVPQECSRSEAPGPIAPYSPPSPYDPVVPVILRLNQQINREARQLLYSENVFILNLASGIHTLSTLHQRSRSMIKHVVLTIPSHHDILDGFADLVRLGLRYCWGLKTFKIILQASLPDDTRNGASSVYANAFHILRWLPRGCSVVLEGCVGEAIRKVVVEEGRLMNSLDEQSYLKRQHQMPERH